MFAAREVHVMLSRPPACESAMANARTVLASELPPLLASQCGIPQPFTEVCNCEACRTNILVRVSGLDSVCGTLIDPRRAILDFIRKTVQSQVSELAILVVDDDVALRELSGRLAQGRHRPDYVLSH